MTTHFIYAATKPLPFYRTIQMFADHFYSLLNSWRQADVHRFEKMFYLIKDPGITDRGTTDHNAIYTITVFIFQCFFRRINITISKNRNLNTGIFFHFRDQCPVSFAFIKLCSCSSMNGQAFIPTSCKRSATSSIFFELSSQPNLVFTVTGNEVDLTTASVNLTIRSISFNTPAPAPFAHYFFYRATKIYINQIRIYCFHNFCA